MKRWRSRTVWALYPLKDYSLKPCTNVLFSPDDYEARFKTFCSTLGEINAAKWAVATYFSFLVFPKQHIFLMPSVTQDAAALSAFEINYRPQLNWVTYECVLAFAEHLRHELAELKPRDMIDVQSFMWCIAPHE